MPAIRERKRKKERFFDFVAARPAERDVGKARRHFAQNDCGEGIADIEVGLQFIREIGERTSKAAP
jgi:hypothetical protein